MTDDQKPRTPLGPDDQQIARMRASIHARIAAETAPIRRRRSWTIGGILAILVLLAGGTSVAVATGIINTPGWLTTRPTPTPTPTMTPTPSSTPSPTPTPTAAPTIPAAFNLPCDRQFDPAVLAAAAPGVTLQPLTGEYEVAPPTGSGIAAGNITLTKNLEGSSASATIALAQSGYYSCWWDGGTGGVHSVYLAVLPQAATMFPKAMMTSPYASSTTPLEVNLGEESLAQCVEHGTSLPDTPPDCELDLLHKGLWISITVRTGGSSLPAAVASQTLAALGGSVLAQLDSTGAEPEPAPIATSRWSKMTDCSQIGRAIGPTHSATDFHVGGGTDGLGMQIVAALQSPNLQTCTSRDSSTNAIEIDVVPGAARWAWNAPYEADVRVTPIDTATLPGVQRARLACLTGGCWADGIIDGAIVTLRSMSPPGMDAARAASLFAAIAAGT